MVALSINKITPVMEMGPTLSLFLLIVTVSAHTSLFPNAFLISCYLLFLFEFQLSVHPYSPSPSSAIFWLIRHLQEVSLAKDWGLSDVPVVEETSAGKFRRRKIEQSSSRDGCLRWCS
jgi:hypothetical protein